MQHNTGFTLIETLIVLVLLGSLYTFFVGNFQARRDAARYVSNQVQASAWSEAVEIERQRGTLSEGTVDTSALKISPRLSSLTPFGSAYRVTTNEHFAVVSAKTPSKNRGGGVLTKDEQGDTFNFSPRVASPTPAMRDKVLLYLEELR